MTEFKCIDCDFSTTLKTNYSRHLKTKKHLGKIESSKSHPKVIQSHPKVIQSHPKSSSINQNKHVCKYCEKQFAYKQGLHKHVKFVCKKNEDEGLKELARLKNEQIKIMKLEKEKQMEKKKHEKEKKKLQKQIEQLSNKLQIQNNVTNNTNNTINNYNVQLLNYKDTDYSGLTPSDYLQCIMKCNCCVKYFVKKVHFNDAFPENKNIFIPNLKNKYIMMYNNNKWEVMNRKKEIENICEDKEIALQEWLYDQDGKYPAAEIKFERYSINKTRDWIQERIIDDTVMILYNGRPSNGKRMLK